MRLQSLLFALLFALGIASVTAAAPKRKAPAEAFPSAGKLMEWINNYRNAPEPDKLPAAVHAMHRLGLLKDVEGAGVFIGFVAGVLGANPEKAETLVAGMFPMPPEEQPIIIKGIAYSGLPEWKALLTKFVERMPARSVMIREYLYGNGKTLYELPLEEGMGPIDTLWGVYFATGSSKPVLHLITALAWAEEKENLDKLTAAGMAKWTLASNAVRDYTLLTLYRTEQAKQKDLIAKHLGEAIRAAELFETQKLRKEALAAIEDLKRKGPVKKGTWWNWAARNAPMAVGLGCVAASALGQVEFGVPCIVGGALSSVGAKYFGEPQ